MPSPTPCITAAALAFRRHKLHPTGTAGCGGRRWVKSESLLGVSVNNARQTWSTAHAMRLTKPIHGSVTLHICNIGNGDGYPRDKKKWGCSFWLAWTPLHQPGVPGSGWRCAEWKRSNCLAQKGARSLPQVGTAAMHATKACLHATELQPQGECSKASMLQTSPATLIQEMVIRWDDWRSLIPNLRALN